MQNKYTEETRDKTTGPVNIDFVIHTPDTKLSQCQCMDLGNSKTASAGGSKPKENTQKNLVPKEMFLSRPPGPKSTFGPPRTAQLNFQRQDQSARSRRGANKAKDGEKERKAKKRKGKRLNL